MPLMKKASKKAEMHSGKPQDQSLAIAYNVQRQAKKKSYAAGGMVEADSADEHYSSIADAILKKKRMADGGMVEPDSMETPANPSPYDEDNMEATMKELYDTDQLEDQPHDSNLNQDDVEIEDVDLGMVDKIRKRSKSKA